MLGALTQADVVVDAAGSYAMRAPARNRARRRAELQRTQRYEGGNLLAARDLRDGAAQRVGGLRIRQASRCRPRTTLSFGGESTRATTIWQTSRWSAPRGAHAFTPMASTRLTTTVSSRAQAPGAEEFQPPADSGIWLPPQRTFSSLAQNSISAQSAPPPRN